LSYVLDAFKQIDYAARKNMCSPRALEKSSRMVSNAIASTTWVEGSPDPKQQDAFMCTSFFEIILNTSQSDYIFLLLNLTFPCYWN